MSPSRKGFVSLSGAGEKMSVNDFHLLKIVGKGAFGKVYFFFLSFFCSHLSNETSNNNLFILPSKVMLVKKKTPPDEDKIFAMKVNTSIK